MKGVLNLNFDLKNLIYLWCKLQLWLKWCPRRGACPLINRRLHIYNGNWTEWSAIWAEIIRVISKSNERAARVRFEITSMISDQNCTTRGSITTLLHPFWNRPNTGLGQFKYFINAVGSRFEIKLIHVTLKKPWNLIGCFVFSVASSLAGKKMRFKAKNGAIRE